MKILHFLFELVSGGAERFVVDLANSQADMGHDVTVCILRPLNEKSGFCRQFLTPKVKFHCLGIERGISLGKTNAVRDYLLAEHPDVLHCHHNILLYLVSYLCGRNKPVIVHTIHSSAKRSVKNLAEKLYCQFLYKHSVLFDRSNTTFSFLLTRYIMLSLLIPPFLIQRYFTIHYVKLSSFTLKAHKKGIF